MYHTFSVKNFRGFDDLTIEGLGRINLIGGKNNIGKTALLEALWVHSWPTEPGRVLSLDAGRGPGSVDPESSIDSLFFELNHDLTIELVAQSYSNVGQRRLKISVQENPTFEIPLDLPGDDQFDSRPPISQNQIVMDYSDENGEKAISRGWLIERADGTGPRTIRSEKDQRSSLRPVEVAFLQARRRTNNVAEANRYSRLEVEGQEGGVLQILQKVEPRLKRLAVVSVRQRPAIYANVGLRRLIPLRLMGDGMSHILSLALAITSSPGGIVLVDEIDNGLHYTVMEEVWKAIAAFARSYDVQIFATTHSRECVYHAYRAFEADEEEEMRFYRIDRAYGKLRAVMYDREMLGIAFEDGLGIR